LDATAFGGVRRGRGVAVVTWSSLLPAIGRLASRVLGWQWKGRRSGGRVRDHVGQLSVVEDVDPAADRDRVVQVVDVARHLGARQEVVVH